MGRLTDPTSKEPTDAAPEIAAYDPPALKAANNSMVPYHSILLEDIRQSAHGRGTIICTLTR